MGSFPAGKINLSAATVFTGSSFAKTEKVVEAKKKYIIHFYLSVSVLFSISHVNKVN